jgi:hypothetical protein
MPPEMTAIEPRSCQRASASGRDVEVVMIDRRWAVRVKGDLAVVAAFDRRADAVRAAHAIADPAGSSVTVFSLGGRPMEWREEE